MKKVDIIGIGAINFDYIFSSKRTDVINQKKSNMDDGDESFVKEHVFKENFLKVQRHSEFIQTQVGGSALLALKTLKSMCPQLCTAYVGTYGRIPEYAYGKDLPQTVDELENCFSSFIDESAWLFKDVNDITGCSLVNLHKRHRQFINIVPGSNSGLLSNIKTKGEEEFIKFLASAKWIHMTSLKEVFQFISIIDYIKKAKDLNSNLKVSIDPGFDYTKRHWKSLKKFYPLQILFF